MASSDQEDPVRRTLEYRSRYYLQQIKNAGDHFDKILEYVRRNKELVHIEMYDETSADNLLRLISALNEDDDRSEFEINFLPFHYTTEELVRIKDALVKTKKLNFLTIGALSEPTRAAVIDIVFALIHSEHQSISIDSIYFDLTPEEKEMIESIVCEDPDYYRLIRIGKGSEYFLHGIFQKSDQIPNY